MTAAIQRAEVLDRMPPFNAEMEEAAVGCCMMDPEVLHAVAEFLKPEAFFRDANRTSYGVILEMYRRGEGVDYISLSGELRRQGLYDEVGGAAYLSRVAQVVAAANGIQYARCVLRLYVRREMIRYATRLAVMGSNDAEDATPELTAGIARLTALRELWERAHDGTVATPCGVLSWH